MYQRNSGGETALHLALNSPLFMSNRSDDAESEKEKTSLLSLLTRAGLSMHTPCACGTTPFELWQEQQFSTSEVQV